MAETVFHIAYVAGIVLLLWFVLNPWSPLHRVFLEKNRRCHLAVLGTVCGVLALCVFPMGLNPYWNGEIPEHRNQYEELAEALLEGHLDIHTKEDVSGLLSLQNPYSYQERYDAGVSYHWDHAFYEGHYYVYFGIVPALLLFMPYRLLFGVSLVSWKGTAVFVAGIVIAFFVLGYQTVRHLRLRVPLVAYLSACCGMSLISVWYFVKYPALYCTAIASGVCFALWALILFLQAFYFDREPKRWKLFLGGLCGALVFGCRPPVGMTEIMFLPLLAGGLGKQVRTGKARAAAGQLAAVLLPYFAVAALLMAYNGARFGNVLEFGQSYQLTLADQTGAMRGLGERFSLIGWLNWAGGYAFDFQNLTREFPWLNENTGVLVLFPVLFVGLLRWKGDSDRARKWFHASLIAGALLTVLTQLMGSPFPVVRYTTDFLFVLCVAALFGLLSEFDGESGWRPEAERGAGRRRVAAWNSAAVCWGCLLAVAVCVLLFFTHGDYALDYADRELYERIVRFLLPRS